MGVTDNELNWRRVFPGPTIDVSGWTLANKMKLPDWCFGNRKVVSRSIGHDTPGGLQWKIHTLALPANVCLWEVFCMPIVIDNKSSYIRAGFRTSIPVNEAQMDAAIPILPYYGNVAFTPPRIYFAAAQQFAWNFTARKGMTTGGGYLVLEAYCFATYFGVNFGFVFSELPTEVPAFLDPQLT